MRLIVTFLLFIHFSTIFALENAFYILHHHSSDYVQTTESSFLSLADNYKKIDILITQAYHIDQKGIVTGFVNNDTINFAKKHNIKLMILVTNSAFNQNKAHQFLSDKEAQKRAISDIVDLCKKNNYYGVQFDFENISIKDKGALTQFYLTATDVLHKKGFKVSYAVVPTIADSPQPSAYLQRHYDNWSGAYDLKALGKKGDFVTVMAYGQHEEGMNPGPTASARWVEAIIQHTLKYIPSHKLSLGIPSYSGYWYLSKNPNKPVTTHLADVSYKEVNNLLQKNKAKLKWNNTDKINYSVFDYVWLNEYLFIEDASSFKAKMNLVKKYKLRGISFFNLGNEDPKIWGLLNNARYFV